MSMQNTRKMKDSGVPWIGDIPEGWEVSKIKYCFSLHVGLSITKENLSSCGIKCINYGYIHNKNTIDLNLEKDNLPFAPIEHLQTHSKCLVQNDDFVFCDTSEDIEGSGNFVYILNDCNEKLLAGSHTIACKKITSFNSRYLAYLCSSDFWKSQIQSKVSGTKVYSITQKILKEALVFFPPLDLQQRIADSLDAKCARIDDSIAKEKELIAKLKEYRQSVITEAVTKGLNKDAPMKDSGIDWIGEIPEHWKVRKLKYVFAIKKDIAHTLGYDILSVTQHGIKIKDISKNEGQVSMDYSKYQLVNVGEFIMNHMDLLTGWVDCSKYEGVTSPDYRVFKLLDATMHNRQFFTYFFQTCYKQKIFYGLGQGVSNFGRWRLPTEQFINFQLPLPPLEEQQEIATYLDKKTSLIDHAMSQKEALIEKLHQYKKSLIYEAVTGKFEV